ncbi:GAF domain-containing protein [Rhodococcus triatomae]|uniref:GAF domain-containing protein n=1 Tax=Rhodococcus triatomae TaxID=300028 RepID=A0A1G8SJR1_9NOCA|nr:helix-turn-helix domain-containing protein [Rhodococcus triatomae]QNG18705.1 GAF domain-containing protein [Rhodococcus triatomae]QNG25384.1 GAF domain-containing protein [Rhodococcus triatomae]SDJ29498.1 GAF domain-containing protein [Rhodococcus triatomae]
MTPVRGPEPAVSAGEDPRHYARLLAAVYDATMAGEKAPARPREVVGDSWRRVRERGVDPDCGAASATVDGPTLEAHRRSSGLDVVVDRLTAGVETLLDDGETVAIIADRDGTILWREGAPVAIGRADGLGFVPGANWAEDAVGTNAIGTALVTRRAVQIFSAEHYVRSHHQWTCAGAPIRDPATGRVIGVLDVSGPARTAHPATVALVDAVSRLAESELREQHRRRLDRLRRVAAPLLAGRAGPVAALDTDGWVAAVDAMSPADRIPLPEGVRAGRHRLPVWGLCEVDPLPGGGLVRPVPHGIDDPASATTVHLDLRSSTATVRIGTTHGQWVHHPSPRHADVLCLLARHRDGLSAADLAAHLFADRSRVVTVRAEMSRLRRMFGGVLEARPYRFADDVDVTLAVDQNSS